MAEYLFLHGKIVVDNTRLYEDGAILADEERVLDIFPHASKIKENIKAYKVNLEGRIILPFFEDKHSFTLNKREEDKPMFINSETAQDYDGIYDLFNGMEFNKEGKICRYYNLDDILKLDLDETIKAHFKKKFGGELIDSYTYFKIKGFYRLFYYIFIKCVQIFFKGDVNEFTNWLNEKKILK